MKNLNLDRSAIFGITLVAGLGLLATITISNSASAQGKRPGTGGGPPAALKWQSDNGNIYVMGGNVGINTDSPVARLHVEEPENGLAIHFPGLRIFQNSASPRIIGGYSGNGFGKASPIGAIIAGGGSSDAPNRAFTDFATVSGGQGNVVNGEGGTVSGGINNFAAFVGATVGGGSENISTGEGATVAGGRLNTSEGNSATIAGGVNNHAASSSSTIAGGSNNVASGQAGSVGGGFANNAEGSLSVVAGGTTNTASGSGAAVGGGAVNIATGLRATIPGGSLNSATGEFSFAAGYRASALHDGAFVWGDSVGLHVESSADNQATFKTTGGFRIFTAGGILNPFDATAGVTLAPGGSAWAAVSDRNAKENFEEVDTREVLNRISAMPILLWNYKSQDAAIRHMGPMAQDFWAAFGLGEDELRINTINADGVALAAIQGLHEIVMEKDAQIADLQNALDAQTLRTTQLEANVFELQQAVNSLLNLIEGNQR